MREINNFTSQIDIVCYVKKINLILLSIYSLVVIQTNLLMNLKYGVEHGVTSYGHVARW
jgi:hypothetical protein